jgi:hypothetical protein
MYRKTPPSVTKAGFSFSIISFFKEAIRYRKPVAGNQLRAISCGQSIACN